MSKNKKDDSNIDDFLNILTKIILRIHFQNEEKGI